MSSDCFPNCDNVDCQLRRNFAISDDIRTNTSDVLHKFIYYWIINSKINRVWPNTNKLWRMKWNRHIVDTTYHIPVASISSCTDCRVWLNSLSLLMLRSETHISQFNLLNLLTGHMWAHLYVFFSPLSEKGGEVEDIWYVVFLFVDDVWISTEATSSSSNPIESERERPHGAEKKVKHQNLLVTNYQTNWIRITQQKRAWS